MAISKKRVKIIIALIAVSLVGLVVLQSLLLQSAVELKEQTFANKVTAALNGVIESYETNRAMSVIIQVSDTALSSNRILFRGADSAAIDDSFYSQVICITLGDSGITESEIPDSLVLQGLQGEPIIDPLIKEHLKVSGDTAIVRQNGKTYNYAFGTSDPETAERYSRFFNGQVDLVERTLNRLMFSELGPLEQRVDYSKLDSILDFHLREAAIDIDYEYGIRLINGDSLLYGTVDNYDDLSGQVFRARMFPYDLTATPLELLVNFPEQRALIWRQMIPMLATISIFMIVIVFSFVQTIKTILEQNRAAAFMTDYVNNMTHEFKTPISTIALAAEALLRSETGSDRGKTDRYSRMIQEENQRMRRQVEIILQMAALEEGDIHLQPEECDIHDIIREVTKTFSLQINQRQGSIEMLLNAEHSLLKGDKVHLTGVLANLLDNAIKYSPDKPQISLETFNGGGGIYIRVKDKGIGIKKDALKMVFQKYYRVPVGDRHDVKGFGLGLSYVRMMVEAHKGNISITSRPGEGTRVEVFLPRGERT